VDIVGIGTDLVEVARFRLAMERRGERLGERLFSEAEREYAYRQKDPSKSLAARFGAKEAVMKAMGVGLWKFKLRDVEVVRAKSGAPSVALYGRAAEMAAERGVSVWHLSLTHTETTALAVAIAMSGQHDGTG
jgi:holo-[acyl-carrier protein] synthase